MIPQQEAAAEQFDRHMVEATGHIFADYEQVRDAGPASLAHIQLYGPHRRRVRSRRSP